MNIPSLPWVLLWEHRHYTGYSSQQTDDRSVHPPSPLLQSSTHLPFSLFTHPDFECFNIFDPTFVHQRFSMSELTILPNQLSNKVFP